MFRSLANRNYRLFISGQVVSNTGTWMQRIAQDWLVLALSDGSGVALGITTALQFLPMMLLGLWGGTLVDRMSKRHLLIATQAAMGLLALGLGTLTVAGHAEVWHVYLFALALGTVTVLDNPGRQTFVEEMVGRRDLPNAVALNSASFQLGRVAGPAIAGLMIAAVGSGVVFLVNAVSFAGVILGLALMRPAELHVTESVPRAKGQTREGLAYILGRPDLLLLLVMTAFVQLFGANVQNQIALITKNEFETGPAPYGIAAAALAVGALSGALLAARRERPRLRVILAGAVLFGALQAVASLMPGYLGFVAVLFPMGLAFMTWTTSLNAHFQLSVPPTMRGRVMAIYMLFFLGMTPVGAPIVGFLADTFGPRTGLAIGGTVSMAVVLLVAAMLAHRNRAKAPPVGTNREQGGQ
ncbi:MFS transporter [Nocardiopsis gilva YIM 90087]|uniref:MFS transporter n=1 Tax=Nocardiopsis gilva YIM 90087 TaxID=1235441 RepID=A0A223SDA1_9ACTN|nr:MFS transporter [Nocardiopsis gilva]ASU86043.1 MFS transporter [Nocardiopsis gilva YIM 90087]